MVCNDRRIWPSSSTTSTVSRPVMAIPPTHKIRPRPEPVEYPRGAYLRKVVQNVVGASSKPFLCELLRGMHHASPAQGHKWRRCILFQSLSQDENVVLARSLFG